MIFLRVKTLSIPLQNGARPIPGHLCRKACYRESCGYPGTIEEIGEVNGEKPEKKAKNVGFKDVSVKGVIVDPEDLFNFESRHVVDAREPIIGIESPVAYIREEPVRMEGVRCGSDKKTPVLELLSQGPEESKAVLRRDMFNHVRQKIASKVRSTWARS